MLFALFIPFLGTALGSAMVFFMKSSMPAKLEKFLLGFAAGVMTAASIFSLLIPSLEMNEGEKIVWLESALGFLSGMFFLLLLDSLIPHLHLHSDTPEGRRSSRISRSAMLLFAVTLHNLPEGMSVGAAYSTSSLSSIALALGIAIQNFPEGAIISMPLASEGKSRGKAFLYGVLSGAVEPVGAFLTIVLASVFRPLLSSILAFASGAMIYVVTEELIPESQSGEHSNMATVGVAFGFALMMILDVAFG